MQTPPGPTGLYDPRFEHDSCGVSFVANIKGVASHDLVLTGLRALTNLEHRGATGAEPDTGDGAGILVQIPDRFLRAIFQDQGVDLPPAGAYAVGMAFLPDDYIAAEKAQAAIETILGDEGLVVVGWRDVPVDPSCLGAPPRRRCRVSATSSSPTPRAPPASTSTAGRSSPASAPSTSSTPNWRRTSRRSRRARSSTRGC